MPALEQVARQRGSLQVLLVSRGEREANQAKAAQHGLTFPILLQQQWEISRAYGMFATPIAYPSSLLSEPWRTLYGLNPMVGVVEGFRWALVGTDTAPGAIVLVSALAALAILISGSYYFRRMEQTFADVV